MRYYTGIGSRKAHKQPHVMAALYKIADALARAGFTVRSGGADGADTAFELAAKSRLIRSPKQLYDIYLPWAGFNDRPSTSGLNYHCDYIRKYDDQAAAIAKRIHKDWDSLKRGGKQMHTRNVYQVLGAYLDNPSDFLICWAPTDDEGVPKGGTRTAWLIAIEHKIPCFNLSRAFDCLDLADYLNVNYGVSVEINL